jgi:hypothetical protein
MKHRLGLPCYKDICRDLSESCLIVISFQLLAVLVSHVPQVDHQCADFKPIK